jgi:hypothetical protein
MSILRPSHKWPRWLIAFRLPEYWHFKIIYTPVFCWIVFKAIFNCKCKFYPFALNKSIDESGGFAGAHKNLINNHFPPNLFPKTIYISEAELPYAAELITEQLKFPFILKPCNLNRGVAVQKIEDQTALNKYINQAHFDIQAEEFLTQGMEVAVFIANPPQSPLRILSLTGKKFLTVTGNGKHSIKELLSLNWRYKMSESQIKPLWEHKWNYIPKADESILIQPIGNHNKGTEFTNETHRITPAMEEYFDTIVPKEIQYGRFDIKIDNWENLETGHNLNIIEFNGNIAEPVSYLDKKYGYFKIQRILFKHYRWQYKIARQMMATGASAPNLLDGFKSLQDAGKFRKSLKNVRIP